MMDYVLQVSIFEENQPSFVAYKALLGTVVTLTEKKSLRYFLYAFFNALSSRIVLFWESWQWMSS
jgi:hypothetical protein